MFYLRLKQLRLARGLSLDELAAAMGGIVTKQALSKYELGTGYGHIALTVDDMNGTLEQLAQQAIYPEREPYQLREGGSFICFVRDPDGYRVELIERTRK